MTLVQLWGRILQHKRATRRLWQTGRSSCARCASYTISSAPSSGYPWSLVESLTSTCFTSRCDPTDMGSVARVQACFPVLLAL